MSEIKQFQLLADAKWQPIASHQVWRYYRSISASCSTTKARLSANPRPCECSRSQTLKVVSGTQRQCKTIRKGEWSMEQALQQLIEKAEGKTCLKECWKVSPVFFSSKKKLLVQEAKLEAKGTRSRFAWHLFVIRSNRSSFYSSCHVQTIRYIS